MNDDAKKRYQRIIQDLGQIPTMPTIASKVMQIVNDPHSSAEDVAKFISRDVALTSKVLRLANQIIVELRAVPVRVANFLIRAGAHQQFVLTIRA